MLLDYNKMQTSRSTVMRALSDLGIGTQVHYIPVYKHPYYRKNLTKNVFLPVAQSYYEKCLSIPLFPSMSDEEVAHVCKSLVSVIKADF